MIVFSTKNLQCFSCLPFKNIICFNYIYQYILLECKNLNEYLSYILPLITSSLILMATGHIFSNVLLLFEFAILLFSSFYAFVLVLTLSLQCYYCDYLEIFLYICIYFIVKSTNFCFFLNSLIHFHTSPLSNRRN